MCTKHTSSWMDGYGRTIARLVLGEGHEGRARIVANAAYNNTNGKVGATALAYYVDSKEWDPVPATSTLVEQRYDAPRTNHISTYARNIYSDMDIRAWEYYDQTWAGWRDAGAGGDAPIGQFEP